VFIPWHENRHVPETPRERDSREPRGATINRRLGTERRRSFEA
jgi:hypothetical protein